MSISFEAPDFVKNNDADTIQKRMMSKLPADIDTTQGGFPYDFTMPTAIEKSELIEYNLVQTLKIMFYMWAWDEWLDYHANTAGIRRKEAGYASGELMVFGVEGTQIPSETIFVTPATDVEPSIEFKTSESYVIGTEGFVKIPIVAVKAGKESNVIANTISLVSKPIKGITEIKNEKGITGGTDREDDESLRQRIQEANETQDISFVGNDNDYIRWAKEVVGVGVVIVIPEWNGAGTVKLVIMDANRKPANKTMLEHVYNYIISPDKRLQRKAPIGAILTVVAPELIKIKLAGKLYLSQGYEREWVIEEFKKNLIRYYEQAKNEGVVKYTRLASILSDTSGVYDYENFMINDDRKNIQILQDEYPETDIIAFEFE